MELVFDLEGTYYSSVIIKMYNKLPKIEFSYHIAKTLSEDIESVFMPLALNLPDAEVSIQNGGVACVLVSTSCPARIWSTIWQMKADLPYQGSDDSGKYI